MTPIFSSEFSSRAQWPASQSYKGLPDMVHDSYAGTLHWLPGRLVGVGARKNDFRCKTFLCSCSFSHHLIRNAHSTNWSLGAIGDWQLKQNPRDTVLQGPRSWCGRDDTQGFGHRLFPASDSSCVTHVSFTLSPRPPSPPLRRPRLVTAPIYLKRTWAPLGSWADRDRTGRWVERRASGLGVGWPGGQLGLGRVP